MDTETVENPANRRQRDRRARRDPVTGRMMPIPLAERFWLDVQKGDGCWNWTGAKNVWGYGKLGLNGRTKSTHRASWELAIGPIPDGLWVLHKCDNRICVRPDHLFLGTPKDNAQDMIAKGRRGWPNSALTADNREHIKFLHANGMRVTVLARLYHVTRHTVSNLLSGRAWKSLTSQVPK